MIWTWTDYYTLPSPLSVSVSMTLAIHPDSLDDIADLYLQVLQGLLKQTSSSNMHTST